MRTSITNYLLFIFFIGLVASCQSAKPTFSKRGETYKSAREIAEEKRQSRKQARMAARSGGKVKGKVASKDRTSRTNVPNARRLDENVETVIQTARSYTGTPYKWGGTTRVGMDCSGLLCTSFQSINVNLPRTSEEQSRFGKTVKVRELKEGDLVFFGANKFSREITHVGMVTEVNNDNEVKFIHASTSLGVIENNLYSDYWQKIFIKAVRPFDE
ncbi:C40 family peptidase [Pontibacter sp. HSC-36F09]|uniref:C40 family peptidase n=1 Tax=Pontibacter sp. HSC-36F09 TaxID=2910966 RepID=UPI0020A04A34|nr:C40 family peptidase [Pontibacter sp. HSC-36F09]MCP2043496.1 cell wall-associated NlpC family hydrolase [Pontibacter sp. HSC-36F09]